MPPQPPTNPVTSGKPAAGSADDLRKAVQKWSPGARDDISLIEQATNEDRTDAEKQEIIGALATKIADDIDKEFLSKFKSLGKNSLELTVLQKLQTEMKAIKSAVGIAASAGGGGGGGGAPGAGGGGGKKAGP